MRDNMYNVDMKRCIKRIQNKTIPGKYTEEIFELIMDFVYRKKVIDENEMSNEEFEEFLKSSMPREYEQMKQEAEEFREILQEVADKSGLKIVHKSEIDQYPDMFGISVKEMHEGKEPVKNKDRRE